MMADRVFIRGIVVSDAFAHYPSPNSVRQKKVSETASW